MMRGFVGNMLEDGVREIELSVRRERRKDYIR